MNVVIKRHIATALSTALAIVATTACSKHVADFTGIWKVNCADYFGVQIQRAGALYAVTFCGLSGCVAPGEWAPDSRIEGDPLYEVVSKTTLRIKRNDSGSFTYHKCSADPFWATKGVT